MPRALKSPVFIVGAARSGTSILYRTLQKHPVFATTHSSLDESYLFRSLPHAWMFRQGYPSGLVSFMTSENAYRAFLRQTTLWRALGMPAGILNELCSGKSLELWRLSAGRKVARSYLGYACEARGCDRLVEKTPTHLPYVPHIRAAFPDAWVIYIHRHPVDVYSSYVRRVAVDGGGDLARLLPVESFISNYRKESKLAARYERSSRRFQTFSYEALTAEPESTLRDICRFVKIEYADDLLTDSGPGRIWAPDPHLFGAIVPHTKDWTDYVSHKVARRIELGLDDVVTARGYQPYTS